MEKDNGLFGRLEYTLNFDNLTLINKDFFDLDEKEIGKSEIMISNIPYKLSSKVVSWLWREGNAGPALRPEGIRRAHDGRAWHKELLEAQRRIGIEVQDLSG